MQELQSIKHQMNDGTIHVLQILTSNGPPSSIYATPPCHHTSHHPHLLSHQCYHLVCPNTPRLGIDMSSNNNHNSNKHLNMVLLFLLQIWYISQNHDCPYNMHDQIVINLWPGPMHTYSQVQVCVEYTLQSCPDNLDLPFITLDFLGWPDTNMQKLTIIWPT